MKPTEITSSWTSLQVKPSQKDVLIKKQQVGNLSAVQGSTPYSQLGPNPRTIEEPRTAEGTSPLTKFIHQAMARVK
jgi:hypothetical protein